MGFGTGLNALLAIKHCLLNDVSIDYTGVEKFLVDWTTIESLNLKELLAIDDQLWDRFASLHIEGSFQLENKVASGRAQILHCDILDLSIDPASFDIVFYDAFGPGAQPELWSRDITDLLYRLMKGQGVLTTFCAQGDFRRNLSASGFSVERIPGPPGKRQMIRAVKP